MSEWKSTACILCECNCGIEVQLGGESLFYYGGGGQGNHLPSVYGQATRSLLGSVHSANALSQEKTGEFWVATKRVGGYSRGDIEHCEVVRGAARRIAAAESVATFEDLGVKMNVHATLVSYLHKLLVLLTGSFGKKVAEYRPSTLVPTSFSPSELTRSEDRDWVAGTPWHKHTPARVEAL